MTIKISLQSFLIAVIRWCSVSKSCCCLRSKRRRCLRQRWNCSKGFNFLDHSCRVDKKQEKTWRLIYLGRNQVLLMWVMRSTQSFRLNRAEMVSSTWLPSFRSVSCMTFLNVSYEAMAFHFFLSSRCLWWTSVCEVTKWRRRTGWIHRTSRLASFSEVLFRTKSLGLVLPSIQERVYQNGNLDWHNPSSIRTVQFCLTQRFLLKVMKQISSSPSGLTILRVASKG